MWRRQKKKKKILASNKHFWNYPTKKKEAFSFSFIACCLEVPHKSLLLTTIPHHITRQNLSLLSSCLGTNKNLFYFPRKKFPFCFYALRVTYARCNENFMLKETIFACIFALLIPHSLSIQISFVFAWEMRRMLLVQLMAVKWNKNERNLCEFHSSPMTATSLNFHSMTSHGKWQENGCNKVEERSAIMCYMCLLCADNLNLFFLPFIVVATRYFLFLRHIFILKWDKFTFSLSSHLFATNCK